MQAVAGWQGGKHAASPPLTPHPAAHAAERDELRGSLAQMLARLTQSSELLVQGDATIKELQEQLQGAEAERGAAQREAAAARADAEAAREAQQREHWKVALLQQMSDLALQQNDAKTATLRQLIESESLLEGGDGENDGPSLDPRAPPAAPEPLLASTLGSTSSVLGDTCPFSPSSAGASSISTL